MTTMLKRRLQTYRVTIFTITERAGVYESTSREYRSTSPEHAKQLAKRDYPKASYFHMARQVPSWNRYKMIG